MTPPRSGLVGRGYWPGVILAIAAAWPGIAMAAQTGGDVHALAQILCGLGLMVAGAKLGGEIALSLGQPVVLGNLVAGVIMGNLSLVGYSSLNTVWATPALDAWAHVGKFILLYKIGLESAGGQRLTVGKAPFTVAALAVVAPFGLAWAASAWLLPSKSAFTHALIATALCATSIGITAATFQSLGRVESREARVVLKTAAIDAMMGLAVLALIGGMVSSTNSGRLLGYTDVLGVVLKTSLFLAVSLIVGNYVSPALLRLCARLRARSLLLSVALAWCCIFAWLAERLGFTPGVGAFAAGLVFDDVRSRDRALSLEQMVSPATSFFASLFFVYVGLRTDLRVFATPGMVGLAAALTCATIVGKQAGSFLFMGRGIDRVSIGIGMVPPGELALIFASAGLGLSVEGQAIIGSRIYSALVVVVILTTVFSSTALRLTFGRPKRTP